MPLTGILGENGAGICWLGRLIDDDDDDDDVSAVASSVEFVRWDRIFETTFFTRVTNSPRRKFVRYDFSREFEKNSRSSRSRAIFSNVRPKQTKSRTREKKNHYFFPKRKSFKVKDRVRL